MRKFSISLFITILSLGLLLTPSSALERESFYQRYHVSPEGLILHLNQTDARSYGDSQNWYNLTGLDHFEQATGANQPTITGALNLAGSCRDADGDDYMQQKEYDTNQGNMTFVADGGSAEFRDDGQNFAEWETTSGNAAYMLVVTTNNGVSWAYAGASNNGGQDIDCYTDLALTTRGWKVRTTPQATPDTPTSYIVLKTNFQITTALSVFMWVKPDDGRPSGNLGLISKWESTDEFRSWAIINLTTGVIDIELSSNGLANSETEQTNAAFFANGQETWHHIGFVYNGTSTVIYGDGIALASTTGGGGVPASLHDTSEKLTFGALSTPGNYFAGLIGPVVVDSRAYSAAEAQKLFNEDRKAFGL